MEPTAQRQPIVLILIAVLLFLGAGAAAYYYFIIKPERMAQLDETYKHGHDLHHQGNFSASIETFQELLAGGPSTGDEAHIRSLIAFDLFQRNQGNDRSKAMEMYRDIILGEAYLPRDRSLVLVDLALLMSNLDRAFYEQHLANTPLAAYLPTTPGRFDALKAAIQMYMQADQMYPSSAAKLYIVNAYAALLGNGALPEGTEPTVVAQLMQEYITQAEPLMSAVSYEPSHVARQRLARALGLETSNGVLKNIPFTQIDTAYKEAMALAGQQEEGNYQLRALLMQTRFFYATFLYNTYGTERKDDVTLLLKEYGRAVAEPSMFALTRKRYENLATRPETDYIKVNSKKLITVSPEYKTFLQDIGWKL